MCDRQWEKIASHKKQKTKKKKNNISSRILSPLASESPHCKRLHSHWPHQSTICVLGMCSKADEINLLQTRWYVCWVTGAFWWYSCCTFHCMPIERKIVDPYTRTSSTNFTTETYERSIDTGNTRFECEAFGQCIIERRFETLSMWLAARVHRVLIE